MKTCSSASHSSSPTPAFSVSDPTWPRRRLFTTQSTHINDLHRSISNALLRSSSSTHPSRRSMSSPTLLVFFIFLSAHCLFSSSPSSNGFSPSLLIQPCEAIASSPNNNNNNHHSNNNQRVDIPSPNEFPALLGTDFAYTQQTPLGGLTDAREYADGALATQKLVAAPMIPIDRQMWVGIDTRTAYFGNQFGGEKIERISQLLQTGMRRLVIDLWWDGTGLGWQLCPRFKRDASQLVKVTTALEQGQKDVEETLQTQDMERNQTEPTAAGVMQEKTLEREGSSPTFSLSTSAANASPMQKRDSRYTKSEEHDSSGKNGSRSRIGNKETSYNDDDHVTGESRKNLRQPRGRSTGHEWFRKKQSPRRPPIKTHGAHEGTGHSSKDSSRNAPTDIHGAGRRGGGGGAEASSLHDYHGRLHGLAMGKGKVNSYDESDATDTAVDGITCSTGEDVVMLLQRLANWMKVTDDTEFEDVLLIVLNLNELGNQSLGSRPPSQQPPTPSPSPVPPATNNTGTAPPVLADPSRTYISPNTNKTIKALLPNRISLKELFTDAFSHLIYSPPQLQMDRDDLKASWWRSGRVGLDYYNTTTDPVTGRIQAPTGWPTSDYLTEVIGRRILVGIGANRLSPNTTYNVTDDFTTLYAPGTLGPSMTNGSLLHISSALNPGRCSSPVPGVAMIQTGSEANMPLEDSSKDNGDPVTTNVTWSFASMSDGDLSPWSFSSGQLATGCGFSALLEGRAPTLSFSEHTAMTIWSWDVDQPPQNQTRSRDRRCGAMQSNGRWVVQDCNMKLPVACRQIDTSGKWLIYDKGASNYRDVTCPPGYLFDVPRTAQENQQLYRTLLQYWNMTAPAYYTSLMDRQRREQQAIELARLRDPFRELLDKEVVKTAAPHVKRQDIHNDGDVIDSEGQGSSSLSTSTALPNEHERQSAPTNASENGNGRTPVVEAKEAIEPAPLLKTMTGVPGGGMVWIDISSWQTAGCWVPGGVHGRCPYQDPDNTVALQEIIKVSTIGGVIMLVLAGMFLYLKCRRNVRHSKDNKRRAMVRDKIMQTEVETVPA